ncbi:MAG: Release factor glutamine methyltransferase [candidate division WS2 bacterium]|nr:Release factor glutamine methyltransferase [Candidatus Lithacetigena glycinireducens]
MKTEKTLQEAILQEKAKGISDLEIGQKYGVTFRYIERLITKSQGINISALKVSKKIKTLYPKDFKEEQTTVWSFKQRGNWATHSGEYRGNWSPYIPRNVILKYSKLGELILDYFCGAGTTAVECKLLGRKCIAFDINDKAFELAKKNINFSVEPQQLTLIDEKSHLKVYEPELSVGDARDLSSLIDNSIDLICAHPPYANIIHYTDSKEGDLSFFDIDEFLKEMSKVAKESFRVLKPGRQCAILIGDTRRKKHVIPLGFKLINVYLDAGFKLKELVIKRQHNCKTTGFWYANSIKYNFLLLAHEYLPIFEKPKLPIALSVKERKSDYGLVVPTLERPPLKKKLDEVETTTVWVLPENDFEKRLNKNVIDRYSNGEAYLTITFDSHSKNETGFFEKRGEKNKGLLFIKSPFLNNNPSHSNIKFYLQKTKEIVNQELSTITNDGFIVIQTQDVRIDGYIEPLAKRLVDMLTLDNLWLKEIIVVTRGGQNSHIEESREHLKITHQYLLVYEKIKGGKYV